METIRLLFITAVLLYASPAQLIAQTNDTNDYLVLTRGDPLYGIVKHVNLKGVSPEYYEKIRITETHGKRKKHKRKAVSSFRVNNIVYNSF
jgi:hypothetical protein